MIPDLENKQIKVSRIALVLALIFIIIMLLPFAEGNVLSGIWAVAFLSFFIAITAVIVAIMYLLRSNKFKKLVSGESAIAQWTLSDIDKLKFTDHQYQEQKKKNKFNFMLIGGFMVVIFGFFIVMMEEDGRVMMFSMLVGFLLLFSFFAFYMPGYFKNKNMQGDGHIIIGKKFAYINGFFYNWDFLLSGIENVEVINEPFHGLHLSYYYYIRSTIKKVEALDIPAPDNINLKSLREALLN